MKPLTILNETPSWRSRGASLKEIWRRWRRRLIIFTAGQLSVQLLTFLTGLLILRWLREDEYAKAGVVLGFQSVLGVFVDLGIGGSLLALIGARGDDRRVVGEYLAAAKWWRRVLLAILMPLGAIAFYGISVKQNWLGQESVVLFTCICVSLYFSGLTAAASAPLTIHQRLGALYLVSNGSNIFRLAACYVLHQYDQLNAVSMAVLGTTITVVSALLYVKAAERHVINPRYSSSVIRQEIRRYVAPLVLATAFYAIQGQLSTFLIAWFGQAQGIAEVTALGRLGQIFNFLSALFAMLIIPNLARLSDAGFARRYPWAILGVLGISLILILTGFAAPQTLLWLLGYRYEHLLQEVSWSVLAGALGFAGGTIWCIHAARKWVFWAGTYFYITAITVVQSGFVLFVNMGSPLNVVLMGVAVNGVALLNQALVSWLGFKKVAKGCQPSPKSV